MNDTALLAPLFFHLATVLAPAVIAGLAMERLFASRSRNRLLYGALALVTALVAIRTLGEILSGGPADAFVVIAALSSPIGWGIILWVVSSPGDVLYGRRHGGGPTAPARADTGPRRTRVPPLLLGEAARVTRRAAKTTGDRVAGPGPVTSPREAVGRWRPASPLPFVPGADRAT